MRYLTNRPKKGTSLLLLALLSLPLEVRGAPPSFDLDLKELRRQESLHQAQEKKAQRGKKTGKSSSAAHEEGGEVVRYTVQPGDHIFKILVVRFGMSNDEAERLIPEIIRINDIPNIKRLSVGQTVLIPGKRQRERIVGRGGERRHEREERRHVSQEKPVAADGEKKAPSVTTAARGERIPQPAREGKAAKEKEAAPVPARAVPIEAVPAPPSQAALSSAPPAAAVPAPVAEEIAGPVWVCSVSDAESSKTVDSVLNALSLNWSRNKIINSQAPIAFSIRVDRYFEHQGRRYIVSIGESDPYNYTLIRLLEGAGYRVLRLTGKEGFEATARKLLTLVGVPPVFGSHPLPGGRTVTGFLLQPDDAGGRRVIISPDKAQAHQKWVMPPGCGGR